MKELLVLTLTIDELRGIVQEEVEQALRLSTKKVWLSEREAQEYTGFSKRHAVQCTTRRFTEVV